MATEVFYVQIMFEYCSRLNDEDDSKFESAEHTQC